MKYVGIITYIAEAWMEGLQVIKLSVPDFG